MFYYQKESKFTIRLEKLTKSAIIEYLKIKSSRQKKSMFTIELGKLTCASIAVDHGFKPQSGQTKDYETSICYFSVRPSVRLSLVTSLSVRPLLFLW